MEGRCFSIIGADWLFLHSSWALWDVSFLRLDDRLAWGLLWVSVFILSACLDYYIVLFSILYFPVRVLSGVLRVTNQVYKKVGNSILLSFFLIPLHVFSIDSYHDENVCTFHFTDLLYPLWHLSFFVLCYWLFMVFSQSFRFWYWDWGCWSGVYFCLSLTFVGPCQWYWSGLSLFD